MKYQKVFIDIISRHLPKNMKLVDFIAELIHLGKEASYRRIRCDVEFTLTEIALIAKKLNINLNSIIINEAGERVVFNLYATNKSGVGENFIAKYEAILNVMEGFHEPYNQMCIVATSIPEEFTINMPFLSRLKLLKLYFESNKLQENKFADITVPDSIVNVLKRYWNELRRFDLVYFLGPSIFLSVASDIAFFYHLNLITLHEKETLKKELLYMLEVINKVASTTELHNKEITLYASHTVLKGASLFLSNQTIGATFLDLNFPDALLSFDPEVCNAHAKRLTIIKRYSSLISQSGEISKLTYINKQKRFLDEL